MTDSPAAPAPRHSLTPHLVVRDAATASDWYQRALGATEHQRIALPGGKLMSVELRLGDSTLMLADEFPDLGIVSPLALGGTPVVLHLVVADADQAWRRALDAGAEIVHPLADQFWGERQGQLLDPFGHKWNLAQHLREVSPQELAEAAAAAFAGQGSADR